MMKTTVRTVEKARRGRPGRPWLRVAAWAVLGVALLGSSAAPGLAVPARVATERSFLDARPCVGREAAGAAGSDAAESDCVRTVRGKVLSAERVKSARTTVFRVRLREPVPPPADRAVNLRADGELAAIVRPGDAIEVRTWRDVQVSVSRDGVSETLPALPDESATMFAGLALVGVWLSIVAFLASFGSARRARRIARGLSYPSRIPFGAAKLAGVVAAPLAVGYLAGRVWDGWTAVGMTVALWALVAVSATLGALRWHRERPVVAPPVAVRPDVEPCGAG